MLTRRELFARGTTLLLLTPVLSPILAGCSSDDSSNSGGSCDGFESTSTVSGGHTHGVCVQTADLDSPPAAGATYTSTNNGGHTHSITLTSAQLASIQAGGTVMVTSTNDDGHTHDWSLKQA